MAINWAEALSGAGAGLQGQLPAYMAAQARRDESREVLGERRREALMQDSRAVMMLLRDNQPGRAEQLLQRRMDAIHKLGGDPADTAGLLRQIQEGDVQGAMREVEMVDKTAVANGLLPALPQDTYKVDDGQVITTPAGGGRPTASPLEGYDPALSDTGTNKASAKTTHYMNGTSHMTFPDGTSVVTDPAGNRVTGQDRQTVLMEARKEGVAFKGDVAETTAMRTERGKGEGGRTQAAIDMGVTAADQAPIVRRSIDLLKSVETGGLAAAALSVKRMTGNESADEAELAQNLGVAVLKQLKPTFGSAFTAAEGERLIKLSASFGKSTEGNLRILGQMMKIIERNAQRGIKAAAAAGDYRTAADIQDQMEYRLSDDEFETMFPAEPTSVTPAPAAGGVKFLGFE